MSFRAPAHYRRALPVLALAVTLSLTAVGCDGSNVSSPTSAPASLPASAPASTTTKAPSSSSQSDAGAVDYSALLLQAGDLSDHEDSFVQRSSTAEPGGVTGASALFVNEADTRAVSDTVAVYPDAATATATLQESLKTANAVVTGGDPQPSAVGTDGTVIRGESPQGDKAVTLLLFTQGRALARLEFQSATGDATTDQFVTSVGKMQHIALRNGLQEAE